MKLTVFGANGALGTELVRQSLAGGHQVTAIVRRPESVTTRHPDLEVLGGSALDPAWTGAGIAGADAVLSVTGTDLRKPTTLYSAGAAAILTAMKSAGTTRFLVVSGTTVGPIPPHSPFERFIVRPVAGKIFGPGGADMREMEAVLSGSEANWTVFRAPKLNNKPGTGRPRTAVDKPLTRATWLSRADLAAAMIGAVHDRTLFRRTVTIAK